MFSCWVGVSMRGESLTKMCFQDCVSCLMKGVFVEGCEGIFYLFIYFIIIKELYTRRERL